MNRKLKLYSNIQPNKGEEIHLMPNSINSYLNYLGINLIKQVDFPNYRINNGRVLLKISEEQMTFITNAEAGCGLIKYGAALVPFVNKMPHGKLYDMNTTRPADRKDDRYE